MKSMKETIGRLAAGSLRWAALAVAIGLAGSAWAAMEFTDPTYTPWDGVYGAAAWRGDSGNFEVSKVADIAADGTIGEPYAMKWDTAVATSGRRFCSACTASSWYPGYTPPGMLLVYDQTGKTAAANATFTPLSFCGLWVKALANETTPYSVTGSGTRATEFGAAGVSSYFKFDKSFTVNRPGTTTFLGDATVEIAQDETFTAQANSSHVVVVDSAATLKLKGSGTLAVTTMTVNGTLDLSAATVPTIVGNVALAGMIVLPAGTEVSPESPFTICTGTLSSGNVFVKIGNAEAVEKSFTTANGAITSFGDPIYIYTENYPTTVPAGKTYTFVGGDTAENTVVVDALDVYGTLKTQGYFSFTNYKSNGSTLDVESGSLTLNPGNNWFNGTLTVEAGATFVNALAQDAVQYNGTFTANIYGTLTMGDTRWSLGGNNTINLYEGCTVTGTGSNSGYSAFDWIENATATLNVYGDVSLAAPIRARASATVNINVDTTDQKGLTLAGTVGAGKIVKKGAGLLKFTTNPPYAITVENGAFTFAVDATPTITYSAKPGTGTTMSMWYATQATWKGTVVLGVLSAPTALPLDTYGNANSKIVLTGTTGNCYLNGTTTVAAEVVIDTDEDHVVEFNNGNSGQIGTFSKISGGGTLKLTGWTGCSEATYNINTFDNFTGTLAINNAITRDGGGTFTIGIGNIVTTGATTPGSNVLNLTQTAVANATGTVVYNFDNAQLNGSVANLVLASDGIYVPRASVTTGGDTTYYKTINEAIQAVYESGLDVTVLDGSDGSALSPRVYGYVYDNGVWKLGAAVVMRNTAVIGAYATLSSAIEATDAGDMVLLAKDNSETAVDTSGKSFVFVDNDRSFTGTLTGNGTIRVNTEPSSTTWSSDRFVTDGWTGTFVVGWDASGKVMPDKYGIAGSFVKFAVEISNGYFNADSPDPAVPNVAPAIYFDESVTLNNGFRLEEHESTFAKVGMAEGKTFTTRSSTVTSEDQSTYYAFTVLDGFAGTLNVGGSDHVTIGTVVVADEPVAGECVVRVMKSDVETPWGYATIDGLKDIQVKVGDAAAKTVPMVYAMIDDVTGLYPAVANVGEDYFATLADAVAGQPDNTVVELLLDTDETVVGWTKSGSTMTKNQYTVTWSIDGTNTDEEYYYGATPTHVDPTKEYYSFTSWTPAICDVTDNVTYTAQFTRNTVVVTVPAVENATVSVRYTTGGVATTGTTVGDYTVDQGTAVVVTYTAGEGYFFDNSATKEVNLGTVTTNREVTAQDTGSTSAAVAQLMPAGTYYPTVAAGVMPDLLIALMSNADAYLQVLDSEVATPNIYGSGNIGYDAENRRYAKAVAKVVVDDTQERDLGYTTLQAAIDDYETVDGKTVQLLASNTEDVTLANGNSVTIAVGNNVTYKAPVPATADAYTIDTVVVDETTTTYTARNWYTWTLSLGTHPNATVDGLPAEVSEGAANKTVSFTVTADATYKVTAVKVGDVTLVGDNGSYSYTVTGNATVTVETELDVVTFTVPALANATVTEVTGATPTGNANEYTATIGDAVTVTYTANDGYVFAGGATATTVNWTAAAAAAPTASASAPVVAVAKIGNTPYETLAAAINAAVAGDTVTLLANVAEAVVINSTAKITLDGQNQYGIIPTSSTHSALKITASNADVELKNITVGDKTYTGRAVNIYNAANVKLVVTNSRLYSTIYTLNVYAEGAGSVDNVDITVTDTEIEGWAALNLWGDGGKVVVTGGKLTGNNKASYSPGNNEFGVIVLEGLSSGTTGATNYDIAVTGTELKTTSVANAQNKRNVQAVVLYNPHSDCNTVKLTNCTVERGEGDASNYPLIFEDTGSGENNTLLVKGMTDYGTSTDTALPECYAYSAPDAEGYSEVVSAVAVVNGTGYTTLQAALDAISGETEEVTIELLADATLDLSRNGNVLGVPNVTKITIDGNNNTLTFVRSETWAQVNTANNATLVLKNVELAAENSANYNKTQYSNLLENPNHNLAFNCPVELNNVTSGTALSFFKDATLDKVTVAETVDVYSIWIHTSASAINIKDLVVNTSTGRGIKVDDTFVSAWGGTASATAITINGATFTTKDKKAAVLVNTSYATTVAASGMIDIAHVPADTTNLVWVDENSAAKFDLVTVTGAAKAIEPGNYVATVSDGTTVKGYYTTLVDAVAAANAADGAVTIELLADLDFSEGVYAGYKWAGSTYNPLEITNSYVTLDLGGHTISNMGNCALVFGHILAKDGGIANCTIKNGTLSAGTTSGALNSYVLGIAGVDGMTIKNVTTLGGINVYTVSQDVVIDSCNVQGTKYYTVCSQCGSEVTIKGTTYTKNTDQTVASKAMFWVQGAGTDSDVKTDLNPTGAFGASSITIEDGTFTVDTEHGGEFYLTGSGKVPPTVKGGAYNVKDPVEPCLVEGYVLLQSGKLWVVETAEDKVIEVPEVVTGETVATITVDPTSTVAQEFLAASEDGKTLEEALSTESENGLMGWQNYVLGQNPSEDLSVSAAPKSKEEASLGKTFAPPAVTDTGFTVTYSIETKKSGTEDEPTKVDNEAAAIDLSSVGTGNNVKYDMKMTVVMTKDNVAVTQTVDKVVGVMKVDSKAKFTIVAVPWKSLGSGDIKVNELLHTGNRSAGDRLYAYDKTNKNYAAGTWELKADKTWEPLGVFKNSTLKYADENMTIKRGQGVWLERVDENEPIYLLGQVVEETATVELETGTAEDPSWNLVASPAAVDLDVTTLNANGSADDQIIVPTAGAPKNYTFNGTTWGYWKPTNEDGIVRKVWTTDVKVPAGTGFWYLNGGDEKNLGL